MEAAKPLIIGSKMAQTLFLLSVEMSAFIKDIKK